MTDKELLELAAKAAGYEFSDYPNDDDLWIPELNAWWNPLAFDGQALRLAVKLRLIILPGSGTEGDNGTIIVDSYTDAECAEEEFGDDPYAATRRAIVRTAAEIGRSMK